MDLFDFIWPLGLGCDTGVISILTFGSTTSTADYLCLINEVGEYLLDESGTNLVLLREGS